MNVIRKIVAGPVTNYGIAKVLNPSIGTEQEYLDSLKGKSAYQSAVDNGFVGTEQEWIESIHATVTHRITAENINLEILDIGEYNADNLQYLDFSDYPSGTVIMLCGSVSDIQDVVNPGTGG